MKVHYDIIEAEELVKKCIAKYGCHPEQNLEHYKCWVDEGDECVFFDFGAHQGLIAHWHPAAKEWIMFTEPMALTKNRQKLFWQFVDYIFERKKCKKLHLETSLEFRKALIKETSSTRSSALPKAGGSEPSGKEGNPYKIRSVSEIYWWPVFNMADWTGDKMEGKSWKRLRNTINKFKSEHKVEFVDSKTIDKEKLLKIAEWWRDGRGGRDRSWIDYFLNIIDNNFKGFENSITAIVDGEPCSITCGWKKPNSNYYYSGVGITNYKYEGLGEVVNMDDLQRCKEKGYDQVDFGGGGKALTNFKHKFKPDYIYKTYNYVLVKKDNA